jgi:hypothetical protein
VHYLAVPLGSWWALAIGFLVAVAWSGVLLVVRLRAMKRRSASQAAP